MRATTREHHRRRMARVAQHIADNVDGDLSLDRLAEVACLSPFHLHRVYRYITGETVADTIRRQRLHRAAGDLLRSDEPIARVARRAGYGSIAAFTRAFAADHGRPPATFRASRNDRLRPRRGDRAMYDVSVKGFEGAHVAALAHHGAYGEINRSFEQLTPFAFARGLFEEGARWFAIYYDDPETVPEQALRSDACVEIGPGTPLVPGLRAAEIAATRVASVVHKGPYSEIQAAYRHLYRTWLPRSGEEAADRPCFEQYLNNPRSTPASELLTEVFLPLR